MGGGGGTLEDFGFVTEKFILTPIRVCIISMFLLPPPPPPVGISSYGSHFVYSH